MFLGIFYNLSMWYKFTGQTQYGAWFTITGAAITVTGLYLLIPAFGSLGAAWTTLICYAGIMILSYITGQKYYPVKYQTGKILFYLLFAVATFLFSKWLNARFSFSPSVSMLISTMLLFIYTGIVLAAERKKPVLSRAD
jgi:O-antigen/teichoic acid export membrane protein